MSHVARSPLETQRKISFLFLAINCIHITEGHLRKLYNQADWPSHKVMISASFSWILFTYKFFHWLLITSHLLVSLGKIRYSPCTKELESLPYHPQYMYTIAKWLRGSVSSLSVGNLPHRCFWYIHECYTDTLTEILQLKTKQPNLCLHLDLVLSLSFLFNRMFYTLYLLLPAPELPGISKPRSCFCSYTSTTISVTKCI